MRLEHIGLNVPDALAMATWYTEHLNMQSVRSMEEPPYAHFLADATGRTILEIYTNPNDPIPDYIQQHPLRFHIAFAVENPTTTKDKLLSGGATLISDGIIEDGSHMVVLRDPWGLVLQFVKRKTSLP
ncbi:MAG: VOC family protein [Sedimentisphaerales bacterium]|nr:VOC family protein [Sedimentisphaerales bacterium]